MGAWQLTSALVRVPRCLYCPQHNEQVKKRRREAREASSSQHHRTGTATRRRQSGGSANRDSVGSGDRSPTGAQVKRVRASGTFTAARSRDSKAPSTGTSQRRSSGPRTKSGARPSSTTGVRQKKSGASAAKAARLKQEEDDLAAVLAAHNKKFRAKSQYEPTLHSIRDVRKVSRWSCDRV